MRDKKVFCLQIVDLEVFISLGVDRMRKAQVLIITTFSIDQKFIGNFLGAIVQLRSP